MPAPPHRESLTGRFDRFLATVAPDVAVVCVVFCIALAHPREFVRDLWGRR